MNEADRVKLYAELIQHSGWALLMQECTDIIRRETQSIMADYREDRIVERAMVAGMNRVLSLPTVTIAQYNKEVERQEAQS